MRALNKQAPAIRDPPLYSPSCRPAMLPPLKPSPRNQHRDSFRHTALPACSPQDNLQARPFNAVVQPLFHRRNKVARHRASYHPIHKFKCFYPNRKAVQTLSSNVRTGRDLRTAFYACPLCLYRFSYRFLCTEFSGFTMFTSALNLLFSFRLITSRCISPSPLTCISFVSSFLKRVGSSLLKPPQDLTTTLIFLSLHLWVYRHRNGRPRIIRRRIYNKGADCTQKGVIRL